MLPALIVLGSILMWFAIWFGTVGLMGLTGWRKLAAAYPAGLWPEPGEGVALKTQIVQVGVARYKGGAIHAALTERGLYLRPIRIFAVNHPTVYVPWTAISEVKAVAANIVELVLEGAPRLIVQGDVARLILEAANAAGVGEGAPHGALELPDEDDASVESLQAVMREKLRAG